MPWKCSPSRFILILLSIFALSSALSPAITLAGDSAPNTAEKIDDLEKNLSLQDSDNSGALHDKDSKPTDKKEEPDNTPIILGIGALVLCIGLFSWIMNVKQKSKEYGLKFIFSFPFFILSLGFILLIGIITLERGQLACLTYAGSILWAGFINIKKSNVKFGIQLTLAQLITSMFSIIAVIFIKDSFDKKRQ